MNEKYNFSPHKLSPDPRLWYKSNIILLSCCTILFLCIVMATHWHINYNRMQPSKKKAKKKKKNQKRKLTLWLHSSERKSMVSKHIWEENLVPHIRNSRQTPVATIRHRLTITPSTHMCITPESWHGSHMQNSHRNSHILYHLQYGIWK